MDLIICLSNLFVPHTLTLIKNSNKKILIYTDQKGMYKFFTELSLPNVDVYLREDFRIKRDIVSVYRFIAKRRELFKWIIRKNPEGVYFFHNTFGSIDNYFIKKLSNKVNVFHMPVFNEFPFDIIYNIESIIGVLKGYFIHGILTKPLWTGDRFIYKLPKKFFIKNRIKILKSNIDEDYINTLISKKFDFAKKEIVLLTGSIIELSPIDKKEYITKVNDIINALGKDRIIAKPHPLYPDRFGLEKELEVIPYYVPANLLYSLFNTFIGYESSVLSEAANYNLKAISTIDYIESNSKLHKKNYKNYLISNSKSGNILFPKTVEEIQIILNNNMYQ